MRSSRQQGIALIESLIATVVLAVGVLGILGVQWRTLADNQTSLRHAQALRLIEDLSERIRMNPRGLAELPRYTMDWGSTPGAFGSCARRPCTSPELADDDRNFWLAQVQQRLPLGDAAVFLATDETHSAQRRQLGVMLRWRGNAPFAAGAQADDQAASKAVHPPATVRCPPGSSCLLQYLLPSARCWPCAGAAAGARHGHAPE